MKITVIGAGSTYTPELMEGLLARTDALPVTEVALHDINQRRLDIVGGLIERMNNRAGQPFTVTATLDRREAIAGADYVLTQIRVGGQQARHDDTVFCLEQDMIGQETTGPAGFAKAMRTIPVMLGICEDVRETAPHAWLVNFTNPAGIITEAVLKYGGVNVIGLCNGPIGMQMSIAKQYGVEHWDVDLEYMGLNHLGFVRRVWIKGSEITDEVLGSFRSQAANIPDLAMDGRFLEALQMYPIGYLRYFYLQSEMLRALQEKPKTRAQEVMEIEERLLQKYSDPNLTEKPPELEKRGGAYYSTAAVQLMESIYSHAGRRHIVNVQNNGSIGDLPEDAAVEVTASVDGRGALPLTVGNLPLGIRGLVQQVKAYEQLTVDAAVHGSYARALQALTANPLVTSVNKARTLLDYFHRHHNLELH